jgi:hypothetical protein
MLKLKHLLHPLRTAQVVQGRLRAHVQMRHFVSHSARRYQDDSRYNLQNVTDGFLPQGETTTDDNRILERICAAYSRSVEDQQAASPSFEATEWWKDVRRSCLRPVIEALHGHDADTLGLIYRNFFRDPCSTGLVSVPFGMSKTYFRGAIQDVYRRSYLGDALYRLDYWASQTGGKFELAELAGPPIGNPFGVSINGTLIRYGADYQHYCARRIINQLDARHPTVAELGGGYGGMAYYLLRDGGRVRYINFDVPETIALASYYLLTAFPQLRFLLHGERPLSPENLANADVVLLPLHQMPSIPAANADLTFSSHAMSDISRDAMPEYLRTISAITRKYFLYIGNSQAADLIYQLMQENDGGLKLVETRPSYWNRQRNEKAVEVECLYQCGKS